MAAGSACGHNFSPHRSTPDTMSEAPEYRSYMCLICGFVYHERDGMPEDGIPPGTRWEDIPLSWRCPDCGAGREDFELLEE